MTSCINCLKKYGLFTKEVGCPNCNYSFCSKCLKNQIAIPKLNGAVKKVCPSCFEKLSKPVPTPSVIGSSNQNILDQKFEEEDILEPPHVDDLLAAKLAALKKADVEEVPPSNDEDIGKRLAGLRGVEYKDYQESNKKFFHAVDTRSEEAKVIDLLKQYEEESNLDDVSLNIKKDPIKDIEERLAKLKGDIPMGGTTAGPSNVPENLDDEDEETATKKVLKKLLEEAKLDNGLSPEDIEFLESIPKPPENQQQDTEELPWCTICNEDAVIRCIDCDNDLFCRACFKEYHQDDEEYREHRTKSYTAPKKANSDV